MKRMWTIIGVADVPQSFKWYQSLLGIPETAPAHDDFGQIVDSARLFPLRTIPGPSLLREHANSALRVAGASSWMSLEGCLIATSASPPLVALTRSRSTLHAQRSCPADAQKEKVPH
jgi:hypothetical protein